MSEISALTILLVEDHAVTRFGLKILLDNVPGYIVVAEAEDGNQAVNLTLEHKPNVVLMDVGLPNLDGIDATKKIKQLSPDSRVVIFTAHDRDDDIFAAFAAGADGYCLKDASLETLLLAISAVASGAGWLDPRIAGRVLSFYSRNSTQPAQPVKDTSVSAALSDRELEVLQLVVDGMSNNAIAKQLFLSIETVKSHMRHIMSKLSITDRTQAAVKALRSGLL